MDSIGAKYTNSKTAKLTLIVSKTTNSLYMRLIKWRNTELKSLCLLQIHY